MNLLQGNKSQLTKRYPIYTSINWIVSYLSLIGGVEYDTAEPATYGLNYMQIQIINTRDENRFVISEEINKKNSFV